MGEMCKKHNVIVFSDEIHCDYVYSGHKHVSFPTLSREMADISLVSINPSKTFNVADFRTAAVMSDNQHLIDRFRVETATQKMGRCSTGIITFVTCYTECDYYADGVRDYTEKNMRFAVDYINERIPGVSAHMPDATYLLWMNCTELGMSQPDLVKFFVEKARVAMNNGADFGVEGVGFMRMNLATPMANVKEAVERIEKAVKAL
jgi:Bifunctional PLP-dependent enzyme with beta-cystathionase and maltose regulon repressor activities